MDYHALLNGPLVMLSAAIVVVLAYIGYRLKAPLAFSIVTVVFLGSVAACYQVMAG